MLNHRQIRSLATICRRTFTEVIMQDSLGLNAVTGASRQYYYLKRAMDIVLTLVLLFLVWPLMLLIAVLIKIDSRGPIFFVQKRVGARRRYSNGQVVWEITTFNMMKFRSMFQDAEQSLHQEYIKAYVEGRENLAQTEGDESIHKLQYDPRITRVGRIIRKTSMDERFAGHFWLVAGNSTLSGAVQRADPARRRLCPPPVLMAGHQHLVANHTGSHLWAGRRLERSLFSPRRSFFILPIERGEYGRQVRCCSDWLWLLGGELRSAVSRVA